MPIFWLFFAAAAAAIDWAAVEKKWKAVEMVAKPATMVALLIWLGTAAGWQGPLLPFALALVFSLAGDVFLLFPDRYFLAGLVAFLLAHLAYIAAFNQPLPSFHPLGLLLAILVGVAARGIYRRLAQGLVKSGQEGLRLPVLVYAAAISLMLLSALLTTLRSDWETPASLLVSAGAILFFLSDTFLAWDRFVAPLPRRGLKVMVAYHLGQFAIVTGAILQYA